MLVTVHRGAPGAATAIEEVLFAETTTLGVRWQEWERTVLDARGRSPVETRVRHGGGQGRPPAGGRVYNVQPEFEDCLARRARRAACR